MPKLSLADLPTSPRAPGEPLRLTPRTDKRDGGIDISGDATMDVYHRMREREQAQKEQARRRPTLARASRILGRMFPR